MPTIPRSEERIVLHNVSWRTYESLLHDFENGSAPRLTYDRGVLEIMSPLAEHEEDNRTLSLIVERITEEWGWDIRSLGSTTFKRADLERGSEPDSCFYIQNAARIAGKREPDLATDPPPDLVIEVDVTHPSIEKLPLYAQIGVPEIWQWRGETLQLFVLGVTTPMEYAANRASYCLAPLTMERISEWMRTRHTMSRIAWLRQIRDWAQQNPPEQATEAAR